jgi:hypothetical protein
VVGLEDRGDVGWIVDELASALEEPTETLDDPTVSALVKRGAAAPKTTLLVPDVFPEEEWRRLDRARSRIEGARIVFVLSARHEALVARVAPNLWSVLAGRVFRVHPETALDADERAERLNALRAAHGLTDEELVERVRIGTIERTADVAEWLVLLGEDGLVTEGPGDRT